MSKAELFEGYTRIYPQLSAEEVRLEVDNLFAKADHDGNGEIDYTEW